MRKISALVITIMIFLGASYNVDALNQVRPFQDNEAPYMRYSVYGVEIDDELTFYLQEKLAQSGIEWAMDYAVCQMYQESSCDPYQDTPYGSGNDCGLFQIRDKYFDYYCSETGITGDIYDYRTQINIYVTLLARRLGAGESLEKAISDWTTGGYTDRICQEYVDDVMSWLPGLEVSE